MPTGRCLCGSIRFTVEGALPPVQVCHCVDCRRAQGGPFATNLPVKAEAVVFTAGEGTAACFTSSPGKRRWFCPRCASPLYSERDALPGIWRLRAGLLDEPVDTRPASHGFWPSRARWWPDADDGLPRHDGAAP